jgi:hypothetical protein
MDGIATTGYRTINSAHTDGATVRYTILLADLTEWEVGEGVWTASGSTLTRVTVYASSNAGSLVTFSAGDKIVFTGPAAADALASAATTDILVGGGDTLAPVWTTAQGSGAPVRATSPTLTTPNIGVATGTSFQGIIGDVTPATGAFTTLNAASGAVGAVSLFLNGESTSGLYRIGANNLGVAISGVKMMDFSSFGIGIGAIAAGSNVRLRMNGSYTDITTTTHVQYMDITHRQTATNAQQLRCLSAIPTLANSTFTNTSAAAAGGAVIGFHTSPGVSGTGQVNAITGIYSQLRNTSSATIIDMVSYQTSFSNSGTVTNTYGYRAGATTVGTNNYGYYGQIASATGAWNLYMIGTADNAIAGNVRIGSVVAPTVALDVTGAVLVSTSIKSAGATSGIGYATGAGGAQTQGTSRTTGVTLSTVSGAITLFSEAGSATPQTFTVTNTAVAATDTITLSQKSGTDLYHLLVTAVAAGSFNITVFTTGGTTTEAPVINFNVIKGVAA